MTLAKAQIIIPILLGQGLFPRIIENPDQSITLVVQTSNGVDSAVLNNFANAQGVTIKSRISVIT